MGGGSQATGNGSWKGIRTLPLRVLLFLFIDVVAMGLLCLVPLLQCFVCKATRPM